MINRLLHDLWLDQSVPWYMRPSLQFDFGENASQANTMIDDMHPKIEHVALKFSTDHLNEYNHYRPTRAQRTRHASTTINSLTKGFNREYHLLTCLGKGGFGQVYDGRRRSDNRSVVIKILPKDRILNWGMLAGGRVPYEIQILSRLCDVPGIIKLSEYFEEPDRFIFTMEKVPNSVTLFRFILDSIPLANTELLRHIFREIININIMLQSYGVWHRDCKPENILYCKTDRSLRFIDFGSATPVQSGDFHEFQGTLHIMAPEWITQKRYNGEKACVWTLGICLHFLLFQQYPFLTKADIINGRIHQPSSPDTDAYRTMRQCLNVNEHHRPKLNNLQYLPWLK